MNPGLACLCSMIYFYVCNLHQISHLQDTEHAVQSRKKFSNRDRDKVHENIQRRSSAPTTRPPTLSITPIPRFESLKSLEHIPLTNFASDILPRVLLPSPNDPAIMATPEPEQTSASAASPQLKTSYEPTTTIQPYYSGTPGCVAIDTEGRILVTGCEDEVVISDFKTGKEVVRIEGVRPPFTSFCYFKLSEKLLTVYGFRMAKTSRPSPSPPTAATLLLARGRI